MRLVPPELRHLIHPAPAPDRPALMLATLTSDRFSDPGWLFERKLDGERCLAVRAEDEVRLQSRNALDLTSTYPEVVAELQRWPDGDFALDGELVAFDGDTTSFSRLQSRLGVRSPDADLVRRVPVVLQVFDVLHVDGQDLTALPLDARKAVLHRLATRGRAVQVVEHRRGDGEAFYAEACANGWEGIIAKRADSRYRAGRSGDWLKFKCVRQQELVVGGYTAPKGSRTEFGALLVGYYEGGDLLYAGKVGTGFDTRTLRRLGAELRRIEADGSPFRPFRPLPRDVRWVRPELVAEIGFAEWTSDGRLRQPRYLGLREDKDARDVRREVPDAAG